MPQLTDPHVAVLAFPFSTHAAPLLTIINSLASASPTTLFSFFSTAQSNNSIFSRSQRALPNVKAYNIPDGVPEGYVFVGKPQENIELFMKVAPENFRKGMEEAVAENGRKVSCLVTDAFFWFAKEMAEEIDVPWLPFWTAGACSLSSHVYTDLIREKFGVGGIVGREEETIDFIPGMTNVCIRDLPEGILFGNLESLFSRMLHQMGQVLPEATAVFINSFEELDPAFTNDLKSKFKRYLNVGPLMLATPPPSVPDSYGCLTWLDKQKPETVAYISFGSVTIPGPNELVAIAEALEAGRIPFIWSLKDEAKAHLPDGFLDKANGMIVTWAPQMDVLSHGAVGVFLSHGGHNSTIETIAVGKVPMIVKPFFGDHRLNGRMIQDVWEIGVILEDGIFSKNGLMSCFDLVLAQEKGKKMRENLRKVKEVAQKAVGPEGSSTENFKALLDLVTGQSCLEF